MQTPDGKIMHVMLVDEFPDYGSIGPNKLKGTPITLKMALENQFWGDRYGIVTDPFGHSWSLASDVRDVTPEEMKAAMQGLQPECGAARFSQRAAD